MYELKVCTGIMQMQEIQDTIHDFRKTEKNRLS